MSSRPEHAAPPEIFYDETEARKYTSSSRIIEIQGKLTKRALELLALPDDGIPRLLLDIGKLSSISTNYVLSNILERFKCFGLSELKASDMALISHGG